MRNDSAADIRRWSAEKLASEMAALNRLLHRTELSDAEWTNVQQRLSAVTQELSSRGTY